MNIAKLNTAYDGGLILDTGSGGGGNSGGGGSTGGGSTSVNDVTFYDYDGTVLYAYTKEDFLKLRELPALPTREGLICQEWNYSIEDAKEYVQEHGKLDIGATYITDDGKTRFYIKVEGERKSFPFMFFISEANSLVIDWGDGATESISGSGSLNVSHTYDKVGDYIISFDVAEGAKLSFSGSKSSGIITEPYTIMLRKLEIGNRTSIGGYAFNKCYSLSSVVIPNGVTSIGNYAFNKCYSLSSVVIPNSVTSINNYAFSSCYILSSVVIPNGVTSIGNNVFESCRTLSSVVIPNSVTSMGQHVFSECNSLSSVVIPNGVTSIGDAAFISCYILPSVVIPNGVTSIGSYAFCNCYSLPSVVIPNGVTSIGSYAFNFCYSLSSVVIPNSVTSIKGNAFYNCTCVALFDFRTHTTVPTLSSSSTFSGIASDCKIVVPDALYDEWIAATNWSTYASQIVKASEFNG